jgi:hypothetical protein
MAEGLTGPDGQILDVDREFAASMAAPPAPNGHEPSAPPARDPEAPYGRRADGTPKAKPGAKRRASEAEAPRTGPIPGPALAPTRQAREKALGGLLQVAAMPCLAVPSLRADAGALSIHGPGIVSAAAEAAEADPRFAALVDRLTVIGPYGALVAATVPLAAQLIRNHFALPIPGTEDPAELRTAIEGQLAERAEAEAAERAYMDGLRTEAAEQAEAAERFAAEDLAA